MNNIDEEILNNKDLEYVEEYMWDYDGWIIYKLKNEDFKRHRINWDKIVFKEQKPEYWPLFCITENWEKFINLRKIENEDRWSN